MIVKRLHLTKLTDCQLYCSSHCVGLASKLIALGQRICHVSIHFHWNQSFVFSSNHCQPLYIIHFIQLPQMHGTTHLIYLPHCGEFWCAAVIATYFILIHIFHWLPSVISSSTCIISHINWFDNEATCIWISDPFWCSVYFEVFLCQRHGSQYFSSAEPIYFLNIFLEIITVALHKPK